MNKTIVDIKTLKPHPQNPNTHPQNQLDELQNSLTQFGQVKNIVIWNGYILAGHGLVESALQSNKTKLEAVDVSDWDEQKAISFMLADNRLADMGIIDDRALLDALAVIGVPENIPGFDEDFLRDIGFTIPDFQPMGPEDQPRLDQKSPIACPHCGEEFVPK